MIYLAYQQIPRFGNLVRIRSENDREIIKNFTPEQKKIRQDYRNKVAKNISENDYKQVIAEFQKMFKEMAGDNK